MEFLSVMTALSVLACVAWIAILRIERNRYRRDAETFELAYYDRGRELVSLQQEHSSASERRDHNARLAAAWEKKHAASVAEREKALRSLEGTRVDLDIARDKLSILQDEYNAVFQERDKVQFELGVAQKKLTNQCEAIKAAERENRKLVLVHRKEVKDLTDELSLLQSRIDAARSALCSQETCDAHPALEAT